MVTLTGASDQLMRRPLAVTLRHIHEWSLVLFAATFPLGKALGEIALVAGLVAWAVRCLLERRVPAIVNAPLTPALVAWFLVALCSMTNSVDLFASLKGLQKLLKYFGLYALLLETAGSPGVLHQVLRGAFIGATIVLMDGVWQACTGSDVFYGNPPAYTFGTVRRITANFGHPADLAIYLMSLIPLAVAYALTAARRVRVYWMVFVLWVIAILMLTRTRGGLLGIVCALGLLSYWMRRWLPALLAAVMVAIQAFTVPPQVKAWAATMPDLLHWLTEPERLMYWQAAVHMIHAHPLVGVGVNTFAKAYPIYRMAGDHFSQVGPYAHNQYLHLAAELGLIGLAIFLAFLGRLFLFILPHLRRVREISEQRVLAQGLAAGLVGYLVFGLLESSLFYGRGALIFWLLVGLLSAIGMGKEWPHARAARLTPQQSRR